MLYKKERKEVNGSQRNKGRTKERIISGIGKILDENTFTGLSVTTVYAKLNINPKLIYLYFGSFDNLVNVFLQRKLIEFAMEVQLQQTQYRTTDAERTVEIIIGQIDKFHQDGALKKLIHWSLVEKQHKLLRALMDSYVVHFRELFQVFVKKLTVAERKRAIAVLDLLISGTFFLSIHSSTNSAFTGMNITSESDRQRIYANLRRHLMAEAHQHPARTTNRGSTHCGKAAST